MALGAATWLDWALIATIAILLTIAGLRCQTARQRVLVVLALLTAYWGARQLLRATMEPRFEAEKASLRAIGLMTSIRAAPVVMDEWRHAETTVLWVLVVGLAALAVTPLRQPVENRPRSTAKPLPLRWPGRLRQWLNGSALIITAILTCGWTLLILCRPRYGPAGIPFTWRGDGEERCHLLAVDVAISFAIFYAAVKGFLLMLGSPERQPFRRP